MVIGRLRRRYGRATVESDRAKFKVWFSCLVLSLAKSLPEPQFPHLLQNKPTNKHLHRVLIKIK